MPWFHVQFFHAILAGCKNNCTIILVFRRVFMCNILHAAHCCFCAVIAGFPTWWQKCCSHKYFPSSWKACNYCIKIAARCMQQTAHENTSLHTHTHTPSTNSLRSCCCFCKPTAHCNKSRDPAALLEKVRITSAVHSRRAISYTEVLHRVLDSLAE